MGKRKFEWQPIETVPRDGRAVLVMRDIWPGTESGRAEECNGHNTYVAMWWGSEWVCYMDQVQDPRCPIEPTHWMPLPSPPAVQTTPIETGKHWAHPMTEEKQLLIAVARAVLQCAQWGQNTGIDPEVRNALSAALDTVQRGVAQAPTDEKMTRVDASLATQLGRSIKLNAELSAEITRLKADVDTLKAMLE